MPALTTPRAPAPPAAAGEAAAGSEFELTAAPGDTRKGRPVPRKRGRRPAVLLRRARLAALAVGAFLVPWCAVLGATLPSTAHAQNWALAWVGLDSAEAIAALSTAALLHRADIRASLTAAAAGTLLFIDAWFDVCTSAPGADHALAMAEAALVEAPLGLGAWWLAVAVVRLFRLRDAHGASP